MSPLTCASPLGGVDDVVAADSVVKKLRPVLGDDVALGGALVELHAAIDSALATLITSIATRLSRTGTDRHISFSDRKDGLE